ncbi:MAG: ATP-binding protein [Lachnospiraceae bacterium]|nr:ATP-binding protein [Lachnospiraceae bacterium]
MEELLLFHIPETSPVYRFYKAYKKNPWDESAMSLAVRDLIDMGYRKGFIGKNLWQLALTEHLVTCENAFSLSCEVRKEGGEGSVRDIALKDAAILRKLYTLDLVGDSSSLFALRSFDDSMSARNAEYGHTIRNAMGELSKKLSKAISDEAFLDMLTAFYKKYGVGMLGLHKAFRLDKEGMITPIGSILHVSLDDLIGYEWQKELLIENTEAFLKGRPANNCLLYGDAGTGKSTSIKAILHKYYGEGLRMIEIYKHEFKYLNNIINIVKNRNYRFIIFMDDLSFDDFEVEYKYLKAVIEGGLEKKPDNILIYATSNRRHLIKESFKDKEGYDDLHKTDTVQEKLSLSARFGVNIYFGSPDKKEFENMVLIMKEQAGIQISDDELLLKANQWEIRHGGLSGRTARQFIDYLSGTLA